MRIHAIILTRNRPETLVRCIDTALSTLGPDDAVTVLDDSCMEASHENAVVLARVVRRSLMHFAHVRTEHLHDLVARATGGHEALWQIRTAPRDIAPQRNLALLISASFDAAATILIDDDVCHFNLESTHLVIDAHSRDSRTVIVGAAIGGMTDQDTLTKLSEAMNLLATKPRAVPAEELFRAPADSDLRGREEREWISAGYMGYRLSDSSVFAFPPGYNEDWLWCLLHDASSRAGLHRAEQTVMHTPPTLRRPTRDDILFELAGDLVLDCLMELRDRSPREPESVLQDLADETPDPTMMPLARAETVLKQARNLSQSGHGRALARLEEYGLGTLRDMYGGGELEMDGSRMVRAWSAHASAQHASFAKTLARANARCALRVALKEGARPSGS